MKVARIAVLGVALLAGVGAAYLVSNQKPDAPQIVTAAPAPAVATDEVLVAAHDMAIGTLVGADDMNWAQWPKSSLSDGMIKKSDTPTAVADLSGSVARGDFFQGEPIRRDKLVKGPSSEFMSAILPSGERAVAINTDGNGATSAGGFILPNDRVDVISTYRDDAASRAAGSDIWRSETVLSNVRVLAIGQNVQNKDGTRVVTGTNATLETDLKGAQALVLAQRSGTLSLVLRSMLDAGEVDQQPAPAPVAAATPVPAPAQPDDSSMTVVRYGVLAEVDKH